MGAMKICKVVCHIMFRLQWCLCLWRVLFIYRSKIFTNILFHLNLEIHSNAMISYINFTPLYLLSFHDLPYSLPYKSIPIPFNWTELIWRLSVRQLRRLEVHPQRAITGMKEVSLMLLDLIKSYAPFLLRDHSRTTDDIELLLRYVIYETWNIVHQI